MTINPPGAIPVAPGVALDRARRIFTSLKDKGAVAQVDETRARAFLQQGRNAEAEKAVDSSVRALEKSEMQAELGDFVSSA